MRVIVKPVYELLDVLMDEGMMGYVPLPVLQFSSGGQLAVEKEVGHLQVVAALCQLLDRVAAISQDAAVTIDESYRALARCCIHEGRVIAHKPEVAVQDLYFAQVFGRYRVMLDGNLVLLPGPVIYNR